MSKLSNTQNEGLIQILNRLCGSTVNTYSFMSKISDINEALDWYFQLAFKAGRNWELDDINKTLPPIDTQNIVSGTNRYKMSSFTEKIINLIKLEILDSSGQGLILTPETFDSLGSGAPGNTSGVIGTSINGNFQELYLDSSNVGTPTHYCKFGDFIYLRPFPNYSLASALKAYFNRPASKFEFVSCQPEADDDLITATAHGLAANDTVIFEVDEGGTISGGLTADTQYYVISSGLTANVFKVSATQGGAAINITSDGSGILFLKTSGEPGIVSIHHMMLCRKAAKTFMQFNNANGVYNSQLALIVPEVAKDEIIIGDFYSGRDKDVRKRLTPRAENNR